MPLTGGRQEQNGDDSHVAVVPADILCQIVEENLAVLDDGKHFSSLFIARFVRVNQPRSILQETHRVIECRFLKISYMSAC